MRLAVVLSPEDKANIALMGDGRTVYMVAPKDSDADSCARWLMEIVDREKPK